MPDVEQGFEGGLAGGGPLDLVIVGPGRLGRAAAAVLRGEGVAVRLIGRGEAIPPAEIVWLTVPDRMIAEVAAQVLPFGAPERGVLLHASGATDLSVLAPHPRAGSLHPLMTFSGSEAGPSPRGPVPAAVAGSPEAVAVARALALRLGWTPFEVPGDRRLYHAAAVMAGNFATTLLAEAAALLVAAGVPAEEAPGLLAALALTSIENAVRMGPRAALTGPVARGDEAVLAAHRAALAALAPEALGTYESLVVATRRLLRPPTP